MNCDQLALLRQIQHLVLIRDEEANMRGGEKIEELSDQMDKLVSQLDAEAFAHYSRLAARNRIFMAPLSKGSCSGCGLKIPTAVMQHVIGKDRYEFCSNCGRMLYLPDVKATGLRTAQPDPKFMLSRFSTAKLMAPSLAATTPEEAIRELCGLLAKENVLSDPEAVVDAALQREAILTTAVGHGLAFPHMRGVEEGVLTFAAGVSPAGIHWGGQVVNLVFFTALPVVASPFYLKLLAALSKSFEDGEKLPFVLAAPDAKTLWKELNKATRVAIKNM